MTSIAVALAGLAGVSFCAMHIVARILDYRREQNAKSEREIIRKELEDEILHRGNVARIAQLRKRLQELDA